MCSFIDIYRKESRNILFLATVSLAGIDRTAHAAYRTGAGDDSQEATANGPLLGQYDPAEALVDATDDYLERKYFYRGLCSEGHHNVVCGLDMGFYFELQRGATLVTELRVCTANGARRHDLTRVTLEGSNQFGSALIEARAGL
jgi:hypothetical protein